MKVFLDSFREYTCDKLDDKGAEYLRGISHGAFRLEHMIKDVFEYFRYGRMQKKKEAVKIDEIIDVSLDQLQLVIKHNNAVIKVNKRGKQWPVIEGDRYQIMRVFGNLIENAIKYQQPKLTPIIHVDFEDTGGDMVTFYIKDNGIGIDSRFFEYVFEVFGRLKDKIEVQGTGMGLAIVKKIVNKHNGNIWLESTKGKGSTFCFTLPRAKK
ncbi:ATP-binding protein [bacterium]